MPNIVRPPGPRSPDDWLFGQLEGYAGYSRLCVARGRGVLLTGQRLASILHGSGRLPCDDLKPFLRPGNKFACAACARYLVRGPFALDHSDISVAALEAGFFSDLDPLTATLEAELLFNRVREAMRLTHRKQPPTI